MEASPIAVGTVCQTDFQAGECETSFRFQTKHMRDVGIETEDNN